MKIATTTGDFWFYCSTDEERIRELHNAGFRYIDFNMYDLTPSCVYMQDGWEQEVLKLKSLADELGVQFVQAHSPGGNPLTDNREECEFLVQATIRSIEICGMLGIKNTVVHSGYAYGLTKEEWFIQNKAFYEKLFPTMEKCGVNVLCENNVSKYLHGAYYLYNGKDMREFVEFVNHPQFHACWDTGHGNCEGRQYDEILAIGKELYAIHYNDNHGEDDEHLIPFLGTLNHDEILHALMDIGFQGYFTLECSSSLRLYNDWTKHRNEYDMDMRLSEPQLFMQRRMVALMYEIAEWMLSSYNILEK